MAVGHKANGAAPDRGGVPRSNRARAWLSSVDRVYVARDWAGLLRGGAVAVALPKEWAEAVVVMPRPSRLGTISAVAIEIGPRAVVRTATLGT